MATSTQRKSEKSLPLFGSVSAAASVLLSLVMLVLVPSISAQTVTVIDNFTGMLDGAYPPSGLTIDQAGNVYGTNSEGGNYGGNCGSNGCGAVFKLAHKSSGWVLTPLYDFTAGNDGMFPNVRVIIGPDGPLYGTTQYGGGGNCQGHGVSGCGTVFRLRPPVSVCKTALCSWNETVLYRFSGGGDGAYPNGEVVFDQAGNIYGTAAGGGTGACQRGCGVVYKLTPSGGGYTQTVLYNFAGGSDGQYPEARLIFDSSGNLYGTTSQGGLTNSGTVFQLTPDGQAWTEKVLYSFNGTSEGYFPIMGVIFDPAGNLYGGNSAGGVNAGGTIFELSPSGGNWTLSLLYSFPGGDFGPGSGPGGDLAIRSGSLYGTTALDGLYQAGNVFRLSPSGGGWTYTSLYDFTGFNDGGSPYSTVVFDGNGNLYGTASFGGNFGYGVAWEITP